MKTKFEKLHEAVHYAQKAIQNQSEYDSATLRITKKGDIYFVGLTHKNVTVCPGANDFGSHYFKVVLSDVSHHCVTNCNFSFETLKFIGKNNLSHIFN